MIARILVAPLLLTSAWVADLPGGQAQRAGAGSVLGRPAVRVYLPRTHRAKQGPLTLGAIAVIRAEDVDLRNRAAAVAMGRSPLPSERIVIDRRTILGRLAASGISRRKVRLTGAERITIKGDEKVIPAQTILGKAKAYLKQNRPGPAGCGWALARKVAPLVIDADEKAQLEVRPAKSSRPGHVVLEVAAVSGKQTLSAREVLFKLTFLHPVAVTTKAIPAGGLITPENTEIRTVSRDRPAESKWAPPFGMEAARALKANVPLTGPLLRPRRLAVVVGRNQPVTMTIRRPGFVVSGKALALQDGRPGDFIKVRNTRSQRIVVAKVSYDGTVEPMQGSRP